MRRLFGTLCPDGRRRYRTAYLEIPKKNGKTTLASGVLAKLLLDDGEFGAEVYSAAATRDQAGMTYRILASMIRQSPTLAKRCKMYDSQKRIYVPATESFYQALSSDASYNDGIDVHAAVIDEVHRMKDGELIQVIRQGMGARRQPLVVMITTAGEGQVGVAWDFHTYAANVLSGARDDDAFFATIYAAPETASPWDEETWLACNPSLAAGVLDMEDFRRAAREAQGIPSAEMGFRRLRLNQWVAASARWFPVGLWESCGGIIKESDLEGRRCFGGIDLSSTSDFTAVVWLFPWKQGGGYDILPRLFLPGDVLTKARRDMRPQIERWATAGLLELTPGNEVDYERVRKVIESDADKFVVMEVGYDRWRATELVQKLGEQGLTVVPVGQGVAHMTEPCERLEALLKMGRINHGGHPVLHWMAANSVKLTRPDGCKLDKAHAFDKVDGIQAILNALHRATAAANTEPQFISFED